jgi:5-methylthioadenosine/S-adenosylhomocysteine deaminase
VHQPVSALVYSARGDEVRRVYVAGRLVVNRGVPVLVDAEELTRRSRAAATALTRRAGTDALARRAWRSRIVT